MLAVIVLLCVGIECVIVKEKHLDASLQEKKAHLNSIGEAFDSIYTGLRTLSSMLGVYGFIFFCDTAYNSNKGQFFGLVVFDGSADNADSGGDHCTQAQINYSHGVQVAGGSTDLLFNSVGYIYSWTIPFFVKQIGAKWTLTLSLVSQCFLVIMAFTKVAALDVFIAVMVYSLAQGRSQDECERTPNNDSGWPSFEPQLKKVRSRMCFSRKSTGFSSAPIPS